MSETNPTNVEYANPPTPRSPRRRAVRTLGLLVLTAGAFTGGMLMRDRVVRWAHSFNQHSAESRTGDATQLWTCGMHPQVIRNKPGMCPICHMALTPLHAHGGADDRVLTIDPVIVQNMGVRAAAVTEGSLHQDVRVVGYVDEPEPAQRDVNLRVSGWIEKLYADTEGMRVKEGEPLFDLYSPEVQVAADELIAARKNVDSQPANADGAARLTSETLMDAGRRKLALWGLQPTQIDEIAKLEKAPATITILSPMTGHVTQKMVVNGSAVKSGDMVMRLSDPSKMWVEAQVYERQLPLVKVGQTATATTASQPGKSFAGSVVFIHPHVDPVTRTARVRVLLDNEEHALKRGMYATVRIDAGTTDKTLLIAREAIIDTGDRQVAFVSLGDGRFEPRDLKVGLSGDDGSVQVLEGLKAGEQVVTSGQFLLDSESRLKEAVAKHLSGGLVANQAKAPATAPALAKVDVPMTDEIVTAYLDLQQTLVANAEQQGFIVDGSKLNAAARMSAGQARGDAKAVVERVVSAAEKLKTTDVKEQRKAFAAVSDAVIELAERAAPSRAVAGELFVIHCPMGIPGGGGADWLQAGKKVANPYMPRSMTSCGELKREVATK